MAAVKLAKYGHWFPLEFRACCEASLPYPEYMTPFSPYQELKETMSTTLKRVLVAG